MCQQRVYMSRNRNTGPHRNNIYSQTSGLGEGDGKGRPITCMKAVVGLLVDKEIDM